jgi:hypothetical protein
MSILKELLLRSANPLQGANPLRGGNPLLAAGLPLVLVLAGCAPQLSYSMPETTAGSIPSVLLRSSQMASRAQQRVSEVLFVQTHPPVVAIAPSHQKAIQDRFNFHWEGPVNMVAFNLASAMGWSMEFAKPQPSFMPSIYVDQHDSDVQQMVGAINRQIMPTAILRIALSSRTLILQVPTKAEIHAAILKGYFPTPTSWFKNAKK